MDRGLFTWFFSQVVRWNKIQYHGKLANDISTTNLVPTSQLRLNVAFAHLCSPDVMQGWVNAWDLFRTGGSHLIVQIQVVEVSICPEMLRVPVQGEVDIPSVALDHHRVPVIVIQEAASSDGGVTQDGAILVTAWNEEWPEMRTPAWTVFYWDNTNRLDLVCSVVCVCILVWPTQIYLQLQLRLAQLQGDVVSLLAFPMENHAIAVRSLEPQRDHVLDDLHLFHLHKRERTCAIQVACYLLEGKEWAQSKYQARKNTLNRYEITPCPSKFITPAPKEWRQTIKTQTDRREERKQETLAGRDKKKWLVIKTSSCVGRKLLVLKTAHWSKVQQRHPAPPPPKKN